MRVSKEAQAAIAGLAVATGIYSTVELIGSGNKASEESSYLGKKIETSSQGLRKAAEYLRFRTADEQWPALYGDRVSKGEFVFGKKRIPEPDKAKQEIENILAELRTLGEKEEFTGQIEEIKRIVEANQAPASNTILDFGNEVRILERKAQDINWSDRSAIAKKRSDVSTEGSFKSLSGVLVGLLTAFPALKIIDVVRRSRREAMDEENN